MAISGSLDFLSASLIGSEDIKVDFVGINTLVNDPVTASSNQLGYDSEIDSATYLNENFMKPTATITVADGDAASGMTEKEYINITSSDGTSKRYVITNAASDGSTATGTVLSDSADTDTGAGTAGADEDGGIAVSINLSSATQNDYLVQLKAAIEHANGHNGKILVSAVPTEADGEQTITLTQAVAGSNSRDTITKDISQLTIVQFAFQDELSLRTEPNQLNSLLLHRNGPYQHPMWKQYRGGDHPVARKMRLNNTMSIDTTFPDAKKREAAKKWWRNRREDMSSRELSDDYERLNKILISADSDAYPDDLRAADLKQYYEPPVTNKYKPLIYDIPSSGEPDAPMVRVRMTFMNQMVYFENSELNKKLKIAGTNKSILALEEGTDNLQALGYTVPGEQYRGFLYAAKSLGAKNFGHSQTIFPRSVFTHKSFKLERSDYEEESGVGVRGYDRAVNRRFWKDSQPSLATTISSDGKSRIRTAELALNSQELTQSMELVDSVAARAVEGVRDLRKLEGSRLLISPSSSFATATVTVADGDAANGMAEKEHITLISTDGTLKRYVITNAASDGSTATGTVLSDSADTDTGAGTAGADEDNGIAVSINLSSATQNDYLVQLKAAIEHANGHNGKITVSSVPTEANGNQAITVTQAPASGPDANSSVTTDISQLTVTNFSGGNGPEWNFSQHFIQNGIIAHSAICTVTGAFATTTVTVADGDAANGMAEKEHITLTSTDGTLKRYVITNAASDGTTATGTVLSDSENTDTGAGTAGADEDNGIAVSINLSSATQNDYLVQLKAAIEHANGHNGKITVSSVPTEANGNQAITLTQAPSSGTDANSSVTTDISQLTVADFSGDNALGSDGLPAAGPSGSFAPLEPYQPYPIALLSSWPLDPRPDIYDKPAYLTSTIGGKGLQIGLTPHRMKEVTAGGGTPTENNSPYFDSSLSATDFDNLQLSGGVGTDYLYTGYWHRYFGPHQEELSEQEGSDSPCSDGPALPSGSQVYRLNAFNVKKDATDSYNQFINIMTGTAGELVYSTKPTMFFAKMNSTASLTGSINSSTCEKFGYYSTWRTQLVGYETQTASLQYNRHTFPYNTPFYATNKIRNRNPFYDSYSDFSEELKKLAKEYSILSEYRVADNIEYYLANYFKGRSTELLYKEETLGIKNPKVNLAVASSGEKSSQARVRVLRNFSLVTTGQRASHLTKLDFLKLDGALHTSSADVTNFADTEPSTSRFDFDMLNLTTTGSDFAVATVDWRQDGTSVVFHEKFAHADNIIEFSHMVDEPFKDGNKTVPSRIKFTVHAVKKINPYKNFYPVTKTVDIGNKFKKFIYEYLQVNKPEGVPDLKQTALQTFLEPFFAPGILYNSLKSGIAVDYPVYTTTPFYFAPIPFIRNSNALPTGAYGGGGDNGYIPDITFGPSTISNAGLVDLTYTGSQTDDRFSKHITSSFNYGGFYMMGACRSIPAILNTLVNERMPFEALYDPIPNLLDFSKEKRLFLTTDFLDLDSVLPWDWSRYYAGSGGGGGPDNIVGDQLHHHPGHAAPMYVRFEQGGADTDVAAANPMAIRLKENFQTAQKNNLYKLSINNFLCETMNFFLADQDAPGIKLPVAISDKKKSYSGADYDKTYYMDVSLEMGKNHVSCEGPRNAGVGGGSRINNIYANSSLNASMRGYIYGPPIEVVQMSGSETITSFPDTVNTLGEVVGKKEPYIRSWRMHGAGAGANGSGSGPTAANAVKGDYESYFAANLQDPAYQAYTPPYFYGKSSMILTYVPASAVETDWAASDAEAVNSGISKDSFFFEQYNTGSLLEDLCKFVPGTSSISMQKNSRMKINSSMNIINPPVSIDVQEKGSTEIYHMWYITPKWVCPVLDFSSSYAAVVSTFEDQNKQEKSYYTYITNSFHDNTTGKGLWGGYGSDPYDEIAMSHISHTLEGRDANDPHEKGVFFSINTPFLTSKEISTVYQSGISEDTAGAKGFYTTPSDTEKSDKSGSLANLIGFEEGKKYPIGRIADSRIVKEAVVVIPYLEKPVKIVPNEDAGIEELYSTREIISGKHFLPIHKTLFENILSINLVEKKFSPGGAGLIQRLVEDTDYVGFDSQKAIDDAKNTDVYKLIDMISGDELENRLGYELPPELDFVHYNIDPFQMFVVPIEHTLKKQELIDIYQGIMPDSSLKGEKTKASFSVRPSAKYDQHSWMPVTGPEAAVGNPISLSAISPQNFLNPVFTHAFDQTGSKLAKIVEVKDSVNVGWLNNSKDFYANLKFMVFKVKQKGMKDYKKYYERQVERAIKDNINSLFAGNEVSIDMTLSTAARSATDVFGYNWPYDDFSLIETAKIDVEIEVEE